MKRFARCIFQVLLCATSVFSVSLWLLYSAFLITKETQRTQRLHREIKLCWSLRELSDSNFQSSQRIFVLKLPKRGIKTLSSQKCFVRSLFDYLSSFEDQDPVGGTNRRQAVRNNDHASSRSSLSQRPDR